MDEFANQTQNQMHQSNSGAEIAGGVLEAGAEVGIRELSSSGDSSELSSSVTDGIENVISDSTAEAFVDGVASGVTDGVAEVLGTVLEGATAAGEVVVEKVLSQLSVVF